MDTISTKDCSLSMQAISNLYTVLKPFSTALRWCFTPSIATLCLEKN